MKVIALILSLILAVIHVETTPSEEFINGNHLFTSEVFKELLAENKGNILVSPISAETILSLTTDGTKGETQQELITTLKLPATKDDRHAAFKEIIANLKSHQSKVELNTANRIYVDKTYSIKDEFKQIATGIYDAGIENVDYGNRPEAANTINKWVEERTNEKIKNLVQTDMLQDVKVILVNALYFKGEWLHRFDPDNSSPRLFYNSGKNGVETETMEGVIPTKYLESQELNAKIVELPYRGGSLSMTIVLPNEKEGISALESNLDKVFATTAKTRERVEVRLPKFKVEASIKFIPILKKMGIKKAFEEGVADLSGMTVPDDLYISEVIQKSFIKVSETGTEAASTTAVFGSNRSLGGRGKSVDFHADHPFIFYVKCHDVILFAGKLNTVS